MNKRRPPSRPPTRPAPAGSSGPGRRGKPRLSIVYEDSDFLIADKAPGVATAHSPDVRRGQRTLMDMVLDHLHEQGRARPHVWVTHRLDAETSGLVMFAKSMRAFEWLKEDFKAHHVLRVYWALVEGAVDDRGDHAGRTGSRSDEPARTIDVPIIDSGEHVVEVASPEALRRAAGKPRKRGPDDRSPRPAITHFKIANANAEYSVLRVRIDTTVRHQIRAHLAWTGHPVAGDLRYGAATDPIRRLALHLAELRFVHPGSGDSIHLESKVPPEMLAAGGEGESPSAAQSRTAGAQEPRTPPAEAASPTSWDEVAGWYDDLVEERRNDLHHQVVLPGAIELLEPRAGERVLDLACGQGVLARELAERGVRVWGIDASPRLIEAAQGRSDGDVRFAVGDATQLDKTLRDIGPDERFDSIACVMALMNMDPLEAVLAGVAARLRPGGRFVAVLLHPVFRSPGRSAWGWDNSGGVVRQYRRIDAYLSPASREIVMNPGKVAHGAEPVVTRTYHRPLETYVRALAAQGMLVDRLEEWASPRQSEPGPRAEEENRARREIPLFLGLRAVRAGGDVPGGPRG
ncbi:MAG: pseudouridine synthase [Phycisphaerales bacterium JB054]